MENKMHVTEICWEHKWDTHEVCPQQRAAVLSGTPSFFPTCSCARALGYRSVPSPPQTLSTISPDSLTCWSCFLFQRNRNNQESDQGQPLGSYPWGTWPTSSAPPVSRDAQPASGPRYPLLPLRTHLSHLLSVLPHQLSPPCQTVVIRGCPHANGPSLLAWLQNLWLHVSLQLSSYHPISLLLSLNLSRITHPLCLLLLILSPRTFSKQASFLPLHLHCSIRRHHLPVANPVIGPHRPPAGPHIGGIIS